MLQHRLPGGLRAPGQRLGGPMLLSCSLSPSVCMATTAALGSRFNSQRSIAASAASVLDAPTSTAVASVPAPAPAPARRRGPRAHSSDASSSLPSTSYSSSDSLRHVPGVGPKNMALLHAHGVTSLADLLAVHVQRNRDPEQTRAYMQEVVRIRNRGHVSMIIEFVHNMCKAHEDGGASSSGQHQGQQGQQQLGSFGLLPKVTLSVEGNISAGKSTFLQILKESGAEQNLQVVPEPVEQWQNVGKDRVNLLMQFYQDPKRYAYTFQNYVFLTRMVQERGSYTGSIHRLLERSVFSDRMVFVRAVHKSAFMNDTELAIYDSWFQPVLETLPTLVPNGFIYLRADPKTCFRRMQKRSRNEETSVQLEYLDQLHGHHEDWLFSGGNSASDSKYLYIPSTNQTLVNARPSGLDPTLSPPPAGSPSLSVLDPRAMRSPGTFELPPVPTDLQGSLRILDCTKGEHMLQQLHQIPALVLDVDADVDVDQDLQYRKHVAGQVRQYTEYVRDYMKAKAAAELELMETNKMFNGYTLWDTAGNVVYTTPNFHTLSHLPKAAPVQRSEARLSGLQQAAEVSAQSLKSLQRVASDLAAQSEDVKRNLQRLQDETKQLVGVGLG